MKGFEMGKGNRDQNTIRPYKGALHGEDWDSYVIEQMKRLREMKSNNKYKQYKDGVTGEIREDQITLIDTDTPKTITVIPVDPNDRFYKSYLEWVAEGNTIEPADE